MEVFLIDAVVLLVAYIFGLISGIRLARPSYVR